MYAMSHAGKEHKGIERRKNRSLKSGEEVTPQADFKEAREKSSITHAFETVGACDGRTPRHR